MTLLKNNPFDIHIHPFCYDGHEYALDVVSGKITACKYVIGACSRYLSDIQKFQDEEFPLYWFDADAAEHFLRVVQKFHHVIGEWDTPNIKYYPWQNFCFMNIMGWMSHETGFRKYRTAHIEIARGNGKAHPLDEIVPTPQGIKEWRDIEVGSELYARDGSVCKVIGKTPVQKYKVYKVKFSDNTVVKCSSGHLWFTSDKDQRGKKPTHSGYESVVSALDIKESLKLRGETNHSVGNASPTAASRSWTDSKISPYFVGHWLGNDMSKGRKFKEEWLLIPQEDRLDLLRGLIDSGGSIFKDSSCRYYSSDIDIARKVRILACSLGLKATLVEKNIPEDNKRHYIVDFTPMDRELVSKGTYKYVDKRYIVDVEETEEFEEMFCVEVDSKDSSYLISDSYIPTHNSAMASQTALYFCAFNGNGSKVACLATRKEQARIVLDSAREMARKNESFKRKKGIEVMAHKIEQTSSFSEIRALSSDQNGLDGLNDALGICDELHAMKKEVFEVISSGMSKRRDSLLLCITTAGFNTESIGHSQSCYAKKVATGEVGDEQFFSLVYTLDDKDDVFDENVWIKANPNYGQSVDPTTFKAKVNKARVTPSDLANLKVKHFNVWISEASAFYSQQKWDLCEDTTLDIEDFRGQKCFIGLDLASKIDLASNFKLFRKIHEDGLWHYYAFDDTYIPEETLREISNTLFEECVEKGYLHKTPGEAIHYPQIEETVVKDARRFKLIAAHYDPWNATQLAQNLKNNHRINMVEFRMNTANLSEPTKTLDALIRQRRFHHNGSPLLRWCLGNVVCKEDAAGNVFPRKSHDRLKIDPIVSALMALAGWIQEEENESVYENRGIRIL